MTPHSPVTRRWAATITTCTLAAMIGAAGLVSTATAAVVPTVPLGTSANYSVLGGSTVTNTGASILHESLGLWPGPAISGFPPGIVVPPGTTDTTNAAAQQAQSDLTAAYVNAAGRPLDATTTADLANLHLQAGVYAGPSKGALALNGPLVLDGAGDPSSVFIFQTDSSLITGSASTVTLVNGAQACNVFWQVGSSATLGTGSVFVGNLMALTSITVTTGVTVEGRALAAQRCGDPGQRHVHGPELCILAPGDDDHDDLDRTDRHHHPARWDRGHADRRHLERRFREGGDPLGERCAGNARRPGCDRSTAHRWWPGVGIRLGVARGAVRRHPRGRRH